MRCDKCGKNMILRKGNFGQFWGCTGYPKCRYTVSVKVAKKVEKVKATNWSEFNPSPSQKNAANQFMAMLKGKVDERAMLLKATAGSGKTTQLEYLVYLALEHNPNLKIQAISFTHELVDELKAKLASYSVDVRTFNSLGNRIVKQNVNAKFDQYYLVNWMRDLLGVSYKKGQKYSAEEKGQIAVCYAAAKLTNMVKATLPENLETGTLREICDRYKIDTKIGSEDRESEVFQLARFAIEKMAEDLAEGNVTIDYADQLYLPAKMGWTLNEKLDVIMVDENQDLNAAQIKILVDYASDNPNTIFVLVGDDNQAIYYWRGAIPQALDILESELSCVNMPLSDTWRNPKTHVALINERLPHIEHNGLKDDDGIFAQISVSEFVQKVAEGDLIICRQNAPLVPHVYNLLKGGKKAIIKGKDIGTNLVNMIARFGLAEGAMAEELIVKAKKYQDEKEPKLRLQGKNDLADLLVDQIATIVALAEEVRLADEVTALIQKIFSDENAPITFSSIHRAKGLESEVVYILRPDLLSYEPNTEESNIAFVALSRSKKELYEVIE